MSTRHAAPPLYNLLYADTSSTGLATYLLLWPDDGVMRKEDIRRIYDGSIFQHKADLYAAKMAGQGRTRKAKKYSQSGY